jgi:hypothetical protein
MVQTAALVGILALAAATLADASVTADAAPMDPGWRVFEDAASGTRVDYPANVFSVPEGHRSNERASGLRFATTDGRAHFAVFTMPTPKGTSPAAFIARNLKVPESALHYERITPAFFAISGVRAGNVYYARCNASSDRSTLHCIYLTYPAKEKRAWDAAVTRISRTLRPLG